MWDDIHEDYACVSIAYLDAESSHPCWYTRTPYEWDDLYFVGHGFIYQSNTLYDLKVDEDSYGIRTAFEIAF